VLEAILEFVLSIAWDVVVQVLLEGFIDWGWHSAGASREGSKGWHPAVKAGGLFLSGFTAGLLMSLLLPSPIFKQNYLPGASLVLSPLLAGLIMDQYGQWREQRGLRRSFAATFWGGVAFAFGMALTRFMMVGNR
jgi:hypothetical protein